MSDPLMTDMMRRIARLEHTVERLLTIETPSLHQGSGAPAHSAPEGTFYWDTVGNALYVNNNGSTSWTAI